MTGRTFTHPSVLQGIADGAEWADPIMDPAEIDWAPRQARAAIPFKVVNGRPVNPCQKTGIEHGRNELGQWDPRRELCRACRRDPVIRPRERRVRRPRGHAGRVPRGRCLMATPKQDDGHDGVQHDDFYAPSAGSIKNEEVRREAAADERRGSRADGVLVTRSY
jgi:hypothetical protein